MTDKAELARRGLLNVGSASLLTGALATAANAQTAPPPPSAETNGSRNAVSADTAKLAQYIAGTLDRDLPADVVEAMKLHILDTIAAMVSGSRLKPGELAGRYVESLGGKPEATVIGSRFLTCSVHAAMANGMAAHADETDDTNPIGPVHLGSMSIPAALAIGEREGRTGLEFLRAATLGYDMGARFVTALGIDDRAKRLAPSCVTGTFVAAAVSAALLRQNEKQVRQTMSYASQQASGMGIWRRDPEHVQKAFDFAGAGSRNGVTAATMVSFGFTGVDDAFSGQPSVFSALAEKPAPQLLVADLGTKFAVFGTTIKKWTVGAPLQAVMDSTYELLKDSGVTAANVARITIEMPVYSLSIVDNADSPDLCAQHVAAMMVVDRGATFASVHDEARMRDPKVLAVRALVDLRGRKDLDDAKPPRQAIVTIALKDGRTLSHHSIWVRGLAQNPMTREEVEAKAVDLMEPILGADRTKRLIAAIAKLETLGPLTNLRPLLQA